MDQPGTIENPANRGNENIPVSVRAREFDLARRVRPSRPASACSFSILRLNLVLTHGIPPDFRGGIHLFKPSYAIGSVPTLSGHAIAYPWRSLPRVRRNRVSIIVVFKVVPVTGAALALHPHGLINARLYFPMPTIGLKWACMAIAYSKSMD